MKTPCPKFPDKRQFRGRRYAERVAVAKSGETGKLTQVYYCPAHSGGCAGFHLTTTTPLAIWLYGDARDDEGEDDGP